MNSIQDCNTQMLSDRGEWILIGPLSNGEPQELTIRSKAGMGRKRKVGFSRLKLQERTPVS